MGVQPDRAGPEKPHRAQGAPQVIRDGGGRRDGGEPAAQAGQEAGLPAPAGARGVDRVERRVLDLVGAHDPYPIKLDLVRRHVEADQRDDHLARRGRLIGVGGDHREHRVDRAPQPVARQLELGLPLPEADQEADRGLLACDLAHLDEGLQAPQLCQVALDELPRQGGVGVHRQRPVVGGLKVEGHLRPARQQLLEQVGRLDGEAPQRLLEALGGALKRGHADRIARRTGLPADDRGLAATASPSNGGAGAAKHQARR